MLIRTSEMEDLTGNIVPCPLCTNRMDYYKDTNFWICQKCKAELWPYTEDTSITESAEVLWRMQQAHVNSMRKKGGSSGDATGKAKDKKPVRTRWLPE